MKVSILIATYNHEPFIVQAIESALMQRTDFEYEVIIGEDCSMDATRGIVRSFGNRYPSKIRLFLPERNLGCNGNAITAQILPMARGEYVAWLDGDDYWTHEDKLQRQVNLLDEHRECSICFHQALNLRPDGSTVLYSTNFGYEYNKPVYTFRDLMFQNFLPTCSVVFRKQLLGELPKWFNEFPSADWLINLMTAQHGDIAYIDEIWGVRRAHSGSVISMKTPKEKLLFNIKCIEMINRYFDNRYQREANEQLFLYHNQLVEISIQEGELENARKHAWACLRIAPFGHAISTRRLLGVALNRIPALSRLFMRN